MPVLLGRADGLHLLAENCGLDQPLPSCSPYLVKVAGEFVEEFDEGSVRSVEQLEYCLAGDFSVRRGPFGGGCCQLLRAVTLMDFC